MLNTKTRMKTTLIICVLAWGSISMSAIAQEEASSSGWWNPFRGLGTTSSASPSQGSKYSDFSGTPMTPAPESSMPNTEASSSWTWPSLPKPQWKAPSLSLPKPTWPSWMKSSGTTSSRSSQPSTLSNWNRSTKRWWKNTTRMMNPFSSSSASSSSSSGSGFHSGYSAKEPTSSSGSSGWGLFNWWSVPEEKKLETPNDFFSLPQP
jgi:hypothetical protein